MLQAGFRSPSQLGSVARLLGCLSWQHQVLQRAGIQSSCCTPNGSVADGDHTFVGAYTPVTKQLWLDRLRMAQQQQQHEQPPAGEAAVGRKPQVTRVDYPFTKDRFLLEMYRNPWGFLRMGRLLEDLDSLAGSIAFQHCHSPGCGPPLLVTAAVDAIEYQRPAVLHADMSCQGQVVYTGGSSLDIRMELLQAPHAPAPSLVALFSFVLLDPVTKRPTKVPQLLPQTEQERQWAAERAQVAAARKAARHAAKAEGRVTLPPEKQQRLDSAVAASSLLVDMPSLADPLSIAAEETSLSNTFVCQPQQRNMHGRIFGGFLMRRAFELAFATTYLFAGSRPAFVRVEDVTFRNPVDVGSLLRFKSHVVDVTYSQQPAAGEAAAQEGSTTAAVVDAAAQDGSSAAAAAAAAAVVHHEAHIAVEVEAVVSQPEQKTTTNTNMFRYVFRVGLQAGQQLRRVLPANQADIDRLTRYLAESD